MNISKIQVETFPSRPSASPGGASTGFGHKIGYVIGNTIRNFVRGAGYLVKRVSSAIGHLPSVISHAVSAANHAVSNIDHQVFPGLIPNLASIVYDAFKGAIRGLGSELLPSSAVIYDIKSILNDVITYEGPAILQDISQLIPPVFQHAVAGAVMVLHY